MTTLASQITSLTVVYSTVYSDADQRKHQSSASLAFVWGIHRDRWIPRTKGQLRGKCFHLMTSSCVTENVCILWYISRRFVQRTKSHFHKQIWPSSLTYASVGLNEFMDDVICMFVTEAMVTHLPLVPHMCVSESVKIMACRLFGTKPLSKPVPGYCQLER